MVKPVRRSRKRILARVRAALGDVPRGEEPEEVAVPRGRAAADGLVDLFVDRLEHYRARPHRVRAADLPEAVAAALRRRGAERVAVPADLPGAWTERTGTGLVVDAGLDLAVLDAVDGVVTGCAVAVAETGTIVLDGGGPGAAGADTGARPPPVRGARRPDRRGRARRGGAAVPTRPLTRISGPSATSDIELDRVEGVPGPRALAVLVVTSPERL